MTFMRGLKSALVDGGGTHAKAGKCQAQFGARIDSLSLNTIVKFEVSIGGADIGRAGTRRTLRPS